MNNMRFGYRLKSHPDTWNYIDAEKINFHDVDGIIRIDHSEIGRTPTRFEVCKLKEFTVTPCLK